MINIDPINMDSYESILLNLEDRIIKNTDKNKKIYLILATYLLLNKIKELRGIKYH